MKKWRVSRETVLETAVIGLALARVCMVPNLRSGTAWVSAHVIQTAELVCCVLWWSGWKKDHGAKNKKEASL